MSKKLKKSEKIKIIVEKLEELYSLRAFKDKDPYKMLIRTILSQRTRDENTFKSTENLFNEYKDIHEIVDADIEDIEKLIKPAGFFRVKAARIKEVSTILLDQYGGIVPDNINELLKLPGVGRKTANCVIVYAFEKPAIPVDTHVHRISNMWGIVDTKNPDQTEEELKKITPKDSWIVLNDLMVQFGQTICRPIHPKCEMCNLTEYCDYYRKN